MKYFLAILMLAFASAKSVKGLPTINLMAQATADQTLAKYLLQPSEISNAAANPAVSSACFAKYLPMLSEVASTFSTQYQACITLAEQRTTNLTAQAAQSMTDFKTDAAAVCSSFSSCDSDTNVLSFFDCYSDAANKDVSIVYDIANSAVIAANTLSVGLKTIQQDEAQCQNATEQTYVTDTAATYQLLDACLAAGDVSTIAPVTVQLPTINGGGAFVVEQTTSTQCSNATGTHTQTSADGTQTQSQTGPGCQSQSSPAQNQTASACQNGAGTHTQTSADGTQTQSQTGPGCQSQSSGDGSSQSQSQSGSGTQSQCSGSDCGEFKPFPPLFTMSPMKPMEPMKPMATFAPFPPMQFN